MRGKGVGDMYLTIKHHDMLRTLIMGFEIPFRNYVADTILDVYHTSAELQAALQHKHSILGPSDPEFLRRNLGTGCRIDKVNALYEKLTNVRANAALEIVENDTEVPVVGGLLLTTFALLNQFGSLYSLFSGYSSYCLLAEKFLYARNKLGHPDCKTLEDNDMLPVLAFIKDMLTYLDDEYFTRKSKEELQKELLALQNRRVAIPIAIQNFSDMPYNESRIVCRDPEISFLKSFICGSADSLRKQHSCCVFGYGGVGKTALVIEAIKRIIQDIQDQSVANEYAPEYVLFFSAKKQKLTISAVTGKVIEKALSWQFQTADELKTQILDALGVDKLRGYHKEGLIIVDNLEALSTSERFSIKEFIERGTPSEMQFIITSRNCEEYEINYKLNGFENESGKRFIKDYVVENDLDVLLTDDEETELLELAKWNTLVLVLSLRRLSKKLCTVWGLRQEFSSVNTWGRIRKTLANVPGSAYEVISEFMFKDTFEEIEAVFSDEVDVFYRILKIFAVSNQSSLDINTICLLSGCNYQRIESVIEILCNYLILEKTNEKYSLNGFAEKYIIGRFMPDAATYSSLSAEIEQREREVQHALEELNEEIKYRPELARILHDWLIISDSDRITAAQMYKIYGSVNHACRSDSRFLTQSALQEFVIQSNNAEQVTAHPFVKYQKARILQIVDRSQILPESHSEEITDCFRTAIFVIKTVEQYSGIQQTKSYASLLWLLGQHLSEIHHFEEAIRYFEESKLVFEELRIKPKEYYQCISQLGHHYLNYYLEDQRSRIKYLRAARQMSLLLQGNYYSLDKKTAGYARRLKEELKKYGRY